VFKSGAMVGLFYGLGWDGGVGSGIGIGMEIFDLEGSMEEIGKKVSISAPAEVTGYDCLLRR
jgi:hypothetical protein